MTPERHKAIKTFLGPGAIRNPLAGDASFRRYERISVGEKSFVLMDAPPAQEDCRPFVALATYLETRGFSAPRVLKADLGQGLLLLEDLGDDTFNVILKTDPKREPSLYRAAVDVLAKLHQDPPPKTLPLVGGAGFRLPSYDIGHLFEELFLFADWYLPALLGKSDPAWKAEMTTIWQPILETASKQNSVLALKDYHADNLMWLADRRDVKKVGLLDFQDARLGHPAYDLVSLLQDARRPYNPTLEADMVAHYTTKTGRGGRRFLADYQILGAQRNAKIIGIFTRLWRRDNKPAYPKMIPHVWGLLEENLKHPALAEARAWFEDKVPGPLRATLLT